MPSPGIWRTAGFSAPAPQEDGVIPGCDAVQEDILADFDPALEFDSGILKHAFEGIDIFPVQPEGGDSVAEHASDPGVRVGDGDVGARTVEPDRGGDAYGAGAYDGDPLACQDVGFPFELRTEQIGVGDFLLDFVPADRDLFHIQDAVAVAELTPVAHPGRNGRERVVVEEEFPGFIQFLFPIKLHAFRDGSMDGTALQGAFGLLAQETALRFVVFHVLRLIVIIQR